MPMILDEDTVAGRVIAATAEARGREQGEFEERVRTLASLMRRTLGDDGRIEALARRLAALPRERALTAALAARTPDELQAAIEEVGAGPAPGP